LFSELDAAQATYFLRKIQVAFELERLRKPLLGESEEHYVASVLAPIALATITPFRVLTLHGEGRQRAAPVHFLGYNMYPDLAIMHFSQRLIGIEAKFVDFSNARGALATAIGQTVIYARAGYVCALAVLIGVHTLTTQSFITAENQKLSDTAALWRICSPTLI
jgi:hypothetical protein